MEALLVEGTAAEEARAGLRDDQSVSLGKTVDCIVISKGEQTPHNYSIYYLSLKDRSRAVELTWRGGANTVL